MRCQKAKVNSLCFILPPKCSSFIYGRTDTPPSLAATSLANQDMRPIDLSHWRGGTLLIA
jgi:hypothetical protein